MIFPLAGFALLSFPLLAAEADPPTGPIGFASISAYGLDHLTGGEGGTVVEVRTAREFQAACERADIKKKQDQHHAPRVIKLLVDIDLGELANEVPGDVLKSVGKVEVRSNTTIISPGPGAVIRHGVLDVHGASNVIIRNLKFRDLWEHDPTGKYDRLGWDYVRITSSGKEMSHHVWVDHCDFGKCYDGQLDITHGSDLVTVSWCHFSGDERGPQKKSMLIGHSSSANAVALDKGRLNVTLHHNWWENIEDRAPRIRTGNVHAFNNLISGAENATISVTGAVTLVENSIYLDTRIATSFSHAADSVAKGRGGSLCVIGSLNELPRKIEPSADAGSEGESADSGKKEDPQAFERAHNFQSSVERKDLLFNPPSGWSWDDRHQLPYGYEMDSTEKLAEKIKLHAGAGKTGM
jgi:pectate lyase